MADVTEQWLSGGDCSKCRRSKYCSKQCTESKRKKVRDRNSLLGQVFMDMTMRIISDSIHNK